jgi:outer membrane protein assembly factor BamE (lipoprotein component of BamABCDE complex)
MRPAALRPVTSAILGLAAGVIAACSPISDERGYVATPGVMDRLEVANQSREDVLRLLGSPSTVSTFNDKTWYYIHQKQEQFAFFGIDTTEQSVVAISFNDQGRIASIKNYAMKDGREIAMVSRKTPTYGKELSVMDQIMGNVGRFSGGRAPTTPGTGPGRGG